MRTTRPSPAAADSKPVIASEVEPAAQAAQAAQAANQPAATTDLIERTEYDSSRQAAQHVAPGARSTGAVPPAPPTYPTIAQHTAASVRGPACLAYVQAAERAGTPVDMAYLQEMGADLLSAKIIAGELGVALNDKVVDAPAMSATSEGIAVSPQDAVELGVAQRLIDRDARRPLCWLSQDKYWEIRNEQQTSLRPQKSPWREAAGRISYAAINAASNFGWLRRVDADLLRSTNSGAGSLPSGYLFYLDDDRRVRGENEYFPMDEQRKTVLVEKGILSQATCSSKVLSLTCLDDALLPVLEYEHFRYNYDQKDLCWLSEVIRLIYGEGQRREHQERLARLEKQLSTYEKSVAGEGVRQPLLATADEQAAAAAAALVRLAIQETRAALSVCVPPLADISTRDPNFKTMSVSQQVAELERRIDTWRDANTASLQMRYRGASQHLADYVEPGWVENISKELMDLRNRQFGDEDDAPPDLLAALNARLSLREGQLQRWHQAVGVTHAIEDILSSDPEYKRLEAAIEEFAKRVAVDARSQLQRLTKRLANRENRLRDEKLALGLDPGFVMILLRDNSELCQLRAEIKRLTACVEQSTLHDAE
jgi:hypothetical protein